MREARTAFLRIAIDWKTVGKYKAYGVGSDSTAIFARQLGNYNLKGGL